MRSAAVVVDAVDTYEDREVERTSTSEAVLVKRDIAKRLQR